MQRSLRRIAACLGFVTAAASACGQDSGSNTTALQVFERRILPILHAKQPSSCTECHLSGVELRDYIFPDQQKTFAALVAAGLVDTSKPGNSKLLAFIERRPEKPSLVTDKVRQEEAAAFRAWLEAAVSDPQLLKSKPKHEPIGPHVSDEVVKHARKDRVLESFIENVWSEAGRCAACHSPDRNQQQVKKFGVQVSWIKLRDPEATLNHLLDSELIDTDEPANSLLLKKPTLQVEHAGGQKMVIGDRTYKQFFRFLEDYAAVVNGRYKTGSDLPKASSEISAVSEMWLKIENVPARFDKKLLRADVFAWTDRGWSPQRVATGDRPVFGGGGLWQQHLSLTAPRESKRAVELRRSQALPPGRYLIKISLDQRDRLQNDRSAELDEHDLIGEVEVETRWHSGYGKMTVVQFPG